jgi:sorbose reductase
VSSSSSWRKILLSFCLDRFTATEQTSGMEQSIKDYQAESVPLRRFAEPHEQGDPALFLISPSVSVSSIACEGRQDITYTLFMCFSQASYITGTILRPDGGFSAY